ncbi:MAG: CRISPR-associated protein [Limnothrix sp.]
MCELNYLITITSLGHLYGSSGGFLSPENLVGRSREKFPPDAATLAGLITNVTYDHQQAKSPIAKELHVIGGFWAKQDNPTSFFVPMPWTKIIADEDWNEWQLDEKGNWQKQQENEVEPEYQWINIDSWEDSADILYSNRTSEVAKNPWKFLPMLHPKMKKQERNVVESDGLFLEQAVQLDEEVCLVYLSSHEIPDGWYRFGGENHMVDLQCQALPDYRKKLFNESIQHSFALITPGIWGSNRFSRRYPDPAQTDFPEPTHVLTDKPIPLRSRGRGLLQRGRYGVPAGSVYVLPKNLEQPWRHWSKDWFPTSGYSLKQVGYSVALPLTIKHI